MKAAGESVLIDFIPGESQVHYKGLSDTVFYWGALKELDQFLPSHKEKGF